MYDARGNKGSVNNNTMFAIAAIMLIAVVFFISLKVPFGVNMAPGGSAFAASTASSNDSLEATFRGNSAKAYLTALRDVDPIAYTDLETKIGHVSGGHDAQMLALLEHNAEVFKANADLMAQADTSHFDAILDLSRDGLRQAKRSRSKWCRGSQYAALEGMSPLEAQRFGEQMMDLEGPLQDFVLRTNTLLLQAVNDARMNPTKHGALSTSDKMALQGLMMSVISDPQVTPLIMQAQSGTDPKDFLTKVNVCEIGITVVLALKTLPQETKGRLWAEAVRQARDGNGDLSQLKGLSGF